MIATASNPTYFDLGKTDSYKRRRMGWFPGLGDHCDGRLGTMRIIVEPVSRSADAIQIDHYGVQDDPEQPYFGCRSFLLENDDDPDEYGPFRCVVGGAIQLCGCEMGRFDQNRAIPTGCKHRAALSLLVEAGYFPIRRRPKESNFMTDFLDGPAQGQFLSLARHPHFLRVTCEEDNFDALDKLDDESRPSERLMVYVFVAVTGTAHISYRDENGRRRGRSEKMVEYRLYEVQPDDATMRDTDRWRAWARAELAKIQPPTQQVK